MSEEHVLRYWKAIANASADLRLKEDREEMQHEEILQQIWSKVKTVDVLLEDLRDKHGSSAVRPLEQKVKVIKKMVMEKFRDL
ncbi:hypothetical protein ACFL1B_05000 [Nanoarchaeota archaeon]